MKYLFFIVVSVGIFLQSFSKMIIFINFQINKDTISKTLCVQKDIKDNCCKGSCHLNKELKEEEKKEQGPASNFKEIKGFQIFYQNNFLFQFNPNLLSETGYIPFPCSKIPSVSFSVFHPPTV